MKNIMDQEIVTLRELLTELYKEKTKDENIEKKDSYIYFIRDYTKKLKEIFSAMRIDIEQYRTRGRSDVKNNDSYDIPRVVAEVFKAYLNEESSKGSFISKLKNRNFFDITLKEKEEFIEKIVNRLKENYKNNPNKEKVYSEIENIRKRWISEAEYNEEIRSEIIKTKRFTNLMIEAGFMNVGGISELDGLVGVNDRIFDRLEYNNIDLSEKMKHFDDSKIRYRMDLAPNDRLELIKYFRHMMKDTLRNWKDIVDIACEIRDGDITESNNEHMSSEELVKVSINDYKSELKRNLEPKSIPEFDKDEMEKILKEIKQEMEDKNK